METYRRPSPPQRRPGRFPKLEALDEWSRKPLSPAAECLTAAASGVTMFLLFLLIYLAS